LLQRGADPNVRDQDGRPAIVAVASSAINLWEEDDGGKTPALIVRDRKECHSAIRALLQAGANPNAKDKGKMSALDWSLELWDNHYDAEIAALLIECGARTRSPMWIEDGTVWGRPGTPAEFVAHVRTQKARKNP
jgi:ankyrin repeat protein